MGRKRTANSSSAIRMSEGEKNDILVAWKTGKKTPQMLAREFGRDESTIHRLIAEFRPTTELAKAKILSQASALVDRVLEKADVDQLIDLLQRPNIGVLDPMVDPKKAGGGPGGVLVNVQAGSLAAVNVLEYSQNALPTPDDDPTGSVKNVQLGPVVAAQAYKG